MRTNTANRFSKIRYDILSKVQILLMAISFLLILSSCKNCEFKSITPDTLPVATVGQVGYYAKIDNNSTCTYNTKLCTLDSGNLPDNLVLIGDGTISGDIDTNKSIAGNYSIRVKYEVCFGSNGYEGTDCHDLYKSYTVRVLLK